MKQTYTLKTQILFTGYLIMTLLFSAKANAQSVPKLQDPSNPFLVERALIVDGDGGLIYWNEGALHTNDLFTTHREHTGLSALDNMIEVVTWKDSITEDEDSPAPDIFHTLYQQYFNGVKVEGAEYTLHHDGEEVWISSGFIAENLDVNVEPLVPKEAAFNMALEHIGATTWSWDSLDGQYPDGELVIIPMQSPDGSTTVFSLAWKFTIQAITPLYNQTIYIDAQTGVILKELNNIHEGDFNHLYYGMKYDLDTRYRSMSWPWSDRNYTVANDDTRNIYTSDDSRYHGTDYAYKSWGYTDMNYSAGDDHWGNDNWSSTAAHYGASKSWDYFKQTPLNRKGMTGWGRHLHVVADHPVSNAYYENSNGDDHLVIGRISNHYLATYDIMGHEFTHGVTQNSRPLPYEKISGALNESFSDIFGYMIERYAFGYHRNWTIGEDASMTLRDMQNPNTYSDPKFYLQPSYWLNTSCSPSSSNDYCGVHTNSGVQNKWFQLLATGGTNNVSGQNRSVGGIGADKAARIAYYTLINYKNYDLANANFNTVRTNSIAAAVILYGMCSNEYNATCAAWYAVNVGSSCMPCAIAWRNDRFMYSMTGNKETQQQLFNLTLFPNPANNTITISAEESNLNSKSSYLVTIYDMKGSEVLSNTYSSLNHIEINIENLPQGVYNVNINSNNWSKNIKFVKN
ncbi:MAG: M4 family metallopeptidase [Bacteroidota bacterium]